MQGIIVRGEFPDDKCGDCGERGCSIYYRGLSIPGVKEGHFCDFCGEKRNERQEEGKPQNPLGVQPPGIPEELTGKSVKVVTESEFTYILALTEKPQERRISCSSGDIQFTKARVMQLNVGKPLILKPAGNHCWETKPVLSIELV